MRKPTLNASIGAKIRRRGCPFSGGGRPEVTDRELVTGYVIEATSSYDWAFGIAGFFLTAGAVIALTMTRNPVDLSEPIEGRSDAKGMASLPTGR